ncbi:MAG: hypothetical protein DRI44_06070 [Chlamydiae bacterium]|nr:MAG: hypothetical protein DRI44_06070 [Chlamydiota bacterium]
MINKILDKYMPFFSLVIAFALCNIIIADDNPVKQNSFAWSLSSGLQNIGTTVSVDEIQVELGTAFGPNLSTGILCLSEAIQISDDSLLTNILLDIGLKADCYNIGKQVWSKAVAREFLRTKILYAIAETNLVLMQGGWSSPATRTEWGIVKTINFNGKISGKTQIGSAAQKSTPEKIIILSVADTSVSPIVLRDAILKNAIKQLDKSILLQDSSKGIISGCDLINFIADRTHINPFCPKCKQNSYRCIYQIFKVIYNDLGAGVRYLNLISQHCPDYEKKEISDAALQLTAGRNLLNSYLDENKLKSIMADRNKQAEMGETIRKLKYNLNKAAISLAGVCNEEIENTDINVNSADWSAKREECKIVRSLPQFSRLNGLPDTFFISATMAAEILGINTSVEWLIALSGSPFKFLIDSNTFTYVSDLSTGYDCMERYLTAAGLVPVFYTFSNGMSSDTGNMIRKEIVESIDRSAPSIISAPDISNEWGIITGYKDYGLSFLCRLPTDSNYFFSVMRTIPDITITIRRKKTLPKIHSQIKGALKQLILLHSQTNFSKYLSGNSALRLWINKCLYYSNGKIMPSLEFAQKNQLLWIALRDNLRKSYRFLDMIMNVTPELVVPLSQARRLYLQAVDLLNLTYADGFVLKKKEGVIYPIDWSTEKSKKQIETLEKVEKLIDEANPHLEFAVKQL